MGAVRLLTERGSQKPLLECVLARQYALAKGIEIVETWTKALRRDVVRPTARDVAVGTIQFVHQRLRASGAEPPPPNDYPEAVRSFLRRDVVQTTLRDARAFIESGSRLFVKPAEKVKRFTGFVADNPCDPNFNGAGARTLVWIAAPVTFVSEWRVYSAAGRVLAVCSAPDNPSAPQQPDYDVISAIAATLYGMPDGFAGVCFDVGVLSDGRTALVEVNEGYGFGAYPGCSPEVLWAVNEARQQQLIAGIRICST